MSSDGERGELGAPVPLPPAGRLILHHRTLGSAEKRDRLLALLAALDREITRARARDEYGWVVACARLRRAVERAYQEFRD
ncbi:MAG TPA: hypothetical protein VFW96_24435 [Thermomicrobiales bacterium]|nr:hypothetical protein [Thermomicrobiales bacterium]